MLSSVSCQIPGVQSLLSVRTLPTAVTATSKLKVLPVHSAEDGNDGRVSGCLCRCAAAACVRRERSYRSAHFRYNKGNTPPKGGYFRSFEESAMDALLRSSNACAKKSEISSCTFSLSDCDFHDLSHAVRCYHVYFAASLADSGDFAGTADFSD